MKKLRDFITSPEVLFLTLWLLSLMLMAEYAMRQVEEAYELHRTHVREGKGNE